MKKLIIVLFIVLSVQIFSQPNHFRRQNFRDLPFSKLIYTQVLVFPEDSTSTINYLYKIPYRNVVFLKNGEGYNAEIRVDIEVTDTNSNFVKREIKDWKIKAASFEQTISSEIYAEGLVKLKLPEGSYYVQPIVTDQNSQKEFQLKEERLDVNGKKEIEPLIINSNKISCEREEFFKLTNFEGNIPFGSGSQNIIIPVSDNSLKEIDIIVFNQNDTIAKKTLTESFISSIELQECEGSILISEGAGIKTNNFILEGIVNDLKEGPFSIEINGNDKNRFNSFVFWYNKPNSLRFPELSIKALKHIQEGVVVDSLLDIDDENQYKALVEFWKKMDPSPETEYNELMREYYSRVDYAQENFSSITGIKGVETDRGKVLVKFGKPDQVERASNEKGKVVETWFYIKPQRKFVFVDKQGVGEFSLESS